MVKPTSTTAVEEIKSPIADLGWLSRDAWSSLRQRASSLKVLGATELNRVGKCIKCNIPSEASIVGEGIFFNQSVAVGSKLPKDQDVSSWTKLISRAVLYRISQISNQQMVTVELHCMRMDLEKIEPLDLEW
jgi:hypothetical protein